MNIITKILSYPWVDKLRTVLLYNWRFRRCGCRVLVRKPIICTFEYISIGDRSHIGHNARIEAVRYYEGVRFNPHIIIGDNVSFQQNIHLTCANSIVIGQNTAIAANVTITDIDHPYDDPDTPVEKQPLRVSSVSIGDDCKIYNNVVILGGVSIGKHVVVGANSVVTTSIPDYCIAAGAPAKVIKKYNHITKQWEKVY